MEQDIEALQAAIQGVEDSNPEQAIERWENLTGKKATHGNS